MNQRRAIHELEEEMKQRVMETGETAEGIILCDFKMKWLPVKFREKTIEHFGKRGISWHGWMLKYFVREKGNDGTFFVATRHVFCDQIIYPDNKQDGFAVLSLLEAFLIQLREEFPKLERVYMRSDNAKTYLSKFLMLMIPMVSGIVGLPVERIVSKTSPNSNYQLSPLKNKLKARSRE